MNFRSLRCGVCFVIATAMTAIAASAAPVYVLQVEADGSDDVGEQYAPVSFAGITTQYYDGVTYHALSHDGSDYSTYSGHAATVRNRLRTADGVLNPITDIWCLSAGDFLDNYVKPKDLGTTNATRPTAVGNSIKVVNHSWVGGYAVTAKDADAVRRLDYMIHREDLVMVNGAVSPVSTGPSPLIWASRNGIAVRGTQAFTPADAIDIGKRHADLWGPKSGTVDEAASYETPGVAGYAAALINEADDHGWNNGINGLRHEVVKSVLMTGADKTATTSNGFIAWASNGVNNLDNLDGAGRADYNASLAVLTAGETGMATVTGATVETPLVTTATAGWWYEAALSGNGSQALIVDLTFGRLTDLTATLAWDVTQTEVGATRIDTTAETGDIFANLDLELVPVTYANATYSLGAPLGIAALTSKSPDDNVEHLYFKDALNPGVTLYPGYYALVVSNTSDFAWNYGFSYRLTAADVLAGDANVDGTVDAADLTLLLNNYNMLGKMWADGDFNHDGTVNVADLTALLNNYNGMVDVSVAAMAGLSVGGTVVPEPGAMRMVMIGLALGLIYFGTRRKNALLQSTQSQ